MPNSRSSALIRLVWAVCSLISRSRSRLARRASSCSGARHPHDPHHPRLAAQIRHQRAQHLLAIDPVGLHPPRPLIHRNARRVKHVVRDPGRQQKPMQPEPVVAGLVAAHHRRNALPAPAPPAPGSGRSTPTARHDRRPPAYGGKSCPCPGCAASPARSSDSVRSQRKSCHNRRWWAWLRSMLASDFSDGSSVETQTYRKGHAHRPMLRINDVTQCDRARQNATTCSSAVFIGEAGNSASASTAIAP